MCLFKNTGKEMFNERKMLRFFVVFSVIVCSTQSDYAKEQHGVYYPTDCEVCKYVTVELVARLEETGKTRDVIETGYNVMDGKNQKKKKYVTSELRLLESLDGVCERIMEYNIHKERSDSSRFAKGMSQTFKTLHGLVDKGVKVDLGMPYDLWDKPSAEVTMLKTKCESLLEKHETDIEDWYFKHQKTISLSEFLCSRRALKKGDDGCLWEDQPNKEQTSRSNDASTKIEL